MLHSYPIRHRIANGVKATGGHLGAGLNRIMGSRAPHCCGILFYHRVTPALADLPTPALNVTPAQFRAQLEGLLRHGYRFWPLARLIDAHRRCAPIPERVVVLTFDDGFANLYHHALPILQDLRVPATVFVVTGYVGTSVPMPFDAWGMAHHRHAPAAAWRSLTWDECRAMEATGLISIMPHTHTHSDFRGRPDVLTADLAHCIAVLERTLGAPRRLFAFPFGDPALGYVDGDLIRAAQHAGATCGLTTTTRLIPPHATPFGWGRLEVVEQDTGATLAGKLGGWYDWMRHVRDLAHTIAPW